MADPYFYAVEDGHDLIASPLRAIIAPRPIAWVSTVSAAGVVNLAPYSFFNMISERPPMLVIGSDGWKDTVANIDATGEFVVNSVGRPMAEQMNLTSLSYPEGSSEAAEAGIALAPSRLVRAPRVAGAPASLECRLIGIDRMVDIDGAPTATRLIKGQIVGVHIAAHALRDGRYDALAAKAIGRCGYRGDYFEVSQMFEMIRPGSPP
ncbi:MULTISPECIES: flavin reductase family protein [unclassified Sphingomonas]|uniref:flavin reductase family protein n=1 Tax=unclassified Sphingomonas TaxID=196159 RepID=UPI0006F7AC27|nr:MULTISPECIES: flavin reductase family protein [unclassified Sphingomonas]KQX23401.1 hypothetical protein ASD17_03610 [Sphingomonas sp. Root1294]KQY68252.1 hypothetical protein ASD39_06130 [Sphingomonas sp. Root50]KRB91149.1 hypothetical protein ASE22_12930 [Sphingomonas sp. Root720]